MMVLVAEGSLRKNHKAVSGMVLDPRVDVVFRV